MIGAIEFTVPGIAQPQGSARARNVPGKSYPIIFTDNPKLKAWRNDVAKSARAVYRGRALAGPLMVRAECYLPRPKSLRGSRSHTTRPDVDKLARGIADALTGIVYEDDSQITQFIVRKAYAGVDESPRAVITVTPLTEEGQLFT